MKIKILYPREDLEILAQVKKTGLNARLIRGGIAIERDFYPGEEYSLPEILLGKELRAVCCAEESGTGLSNTGHAKIICSDDGSALSPVYVPSRPRMGTPQAFFEIAKGIKVKINRWHSDVTVTIISFAVSVVDCKVKYEETELWEGAPKELPDCLSQFEAAIKAGMKKASDYHCSCAHYIR